MEKKNTKVTDFFKKSALPKNESKKELENRTSTLHFSSKNLPASFTRQESSSDAGVQTGSSTAGLSAARRNGGQRVLERGRTVIKSSDDEGSADSDTSLASLGDVLGVTKPATSSWKDRNPGSFSTPATALPKYTFSLDSLVDRTEKDAASEAGVARARQAIQLSTAQSDLQHGVDRTSDPLIEPTNEVDRGLLKSVMDQSTEKGGMQKIMQAMNRTEALNRPKTWSFFHQQAPNLTVERRPLPEECLSSSGWEAMLKDPLLRYQAFLSGFAAEMILSQGSLPDKLFLWLLEDICLEQCDILRFSYIAAVQSVPCQVHNLITPERVDHLLKVLGASSEGINLKEPIQPVPEPINEHVEHVRSDWTTVLSFIELLEGIAPKLSVVLVEHVLCLLARFCLDPAVSLVADLQVSIHRAFTSLTQSLSDDQWQQSAVRVSKTMYECVQQSPFRLNLLKTMPLDTARTHLLRRRLALAFFFEDQTYLSRDADSLLDIRALTQAIRHKKVVIDIDTDYVELAALISILDIGLDNGLSCSSPLTKQEEDDFNLNVDELAREIRAIFVQIKDTGASHMTRTEAKEVLNRVYYRVVFGVRTKRKPRKNLFQSKLADRQGDVAG